MIKCSLSGAYINKYSIHIQPKKPVFSKHDGRDFAITVPQHLFQALRLPIGKMHTQYHPSVIKRNGANHTMKMVG